MDAYATPSLRRAAPDTRRSREYGVGREGYSLVELIAVLALLAVGVATAVPSVRRFADEAAVAAAREEVARGLLRARTSAVQSGGSVVTIVADPPTLRVVAAGVVVHQALLADGRTSVELTGSRDSLDLRFDALGIGRFTSSTISLRRGQADAGLVLSSYGRVRRR